MLYHCYRNVDVTGIGLQILTSLPEEESRYKNNIQYINPTYDK